MRVSHANILGGKNDPRRGSSQCKGPKTVSWSGMRQVGGRVAAKLRQVRGNGENRSAQLLEGLVGHIDFIFHSTYGKALEGFEEK